MCGLAGLVTAEAGAAQLLHAMSHALAHRGPDGSGSLACTAGGELQAIDQLKPGEPACLLAHRRLAVIDPGPAGRQPMASADGRSWIVFNGEIYNHRELAGELRREGLQLRTRCDTEVLVEALARWGLDALSRLEGMYAFAWLDLATKSLLLARDPLGIKPLYVAQSARGIGFASEQKALLDLPWVERRVDWALAADYLALGLSDHAGGSMLHGLRQLAGGSWLRIGLGSAAVEAEGRFWSPPRRRLHADGGDPVARCRKLLGAAVRSHLVADVPVGGALSGGLDSSAITALAQGSSADSFQAIGFLAGERAIDERRWMRLLRDRVGCRLDELAVPAAAWVEDVDDLILTQDEPFGSSSIHAQYLVFRRARELGLTVMLDGQGADELFAGYLPQLQAAIAGRLLRGDLGGALRRALGAGRAGPWGPLGLSLRALRTALGHALPGLPRPQQAAAPWLVGLAPSRPPRGAGPLPLGSALQRAVLVDSLPMLLRFEDRNSMRWGIESRVPFCDRRLVEFALALPEEWLVDAGGRSKAVLRRALRGVVPDPILRRRDKIGFATPEDRWLRAGAPWVESVLADADRSALPLLDLDALRGYWQRYREGVAPYRRELWRSINLIRWQQLHGLR